MNRRQFFQKSIVVAAATMTSAGVGYGIGKAGSELVIDETVIADESLREEFKKYTVWGTVAGTALPMAYRVIREQLFSNNL